MDVQGMLVGADEDLYRRMRIDLVRYASVLVGPDDAADVVSDAVISATTHRSWPTADKPAYLYRSVTNAARMQMRSAVRRRAREERVAPPEAVFDAHSDIDTIRAIARLSVRQRACVYLMYWEQATVPEIAERLGIGEGSVRRHLARARSRLRELMA